MQSVVASSRSNGSTISQANTAGEGLTEHDYIGLSEASSSSHRPADCGETDLKLGLSLTTGSYKPDNSGYGPQARSQYQQWCGAGRWPRGFEHWVAQDRSSIWQPQPQPQVLRGTRILTAQDLQPPATPTPVESGYGFANPPGRAPAPATVAGAKRARGESVEPDGSSANSKGQVVVGWPPIKSYRKNTLASQPKPPGEVGPEEGVVVHPSNNSVQNQGASFYVKVNMDGVPIGRKVDLNAHGSYETLALALEDMFHRSNSGGAQGPAERGHHGAATDSKPASLLHGLPEYELTYEDREGDWMLVGDVPWRMFVSSVKRLRIMKTSEANGLAPRCSEKMNRQKNKGV